jgi:hypothetical protein
MLAGTSEYARGYILIDAAIRFRLRGRRHASEPLCYKRSPRKADVDTGVSDCRKYGAGIKATGDYPPLMLIPKASAKPERLGERLWLRTILS